MLAANRSLNKSRSRSDEQDGGRLCHSALRALGAGAAGVARPAPAQTADAFYKGKQIRFIVGTAAGQDYDTWARLIGRYLPRFLPGNPTFIVENMPGAGHILATNYLFNLAPRDGTAIGMVSRNMTEAAVMKLPNVRFDPGKFNWIGSPELNHRVLFVNVASGFDKVSDLFERELIVGTPGGAQGVSAAPILLKNLLHMRLKIIQGYHSPGDVILAMARREVDGVVQTLGAPEGARRQWIESGQMRVMFNMEHERGRGARCADHLRVRQDRGRAPGAGLLLLAAWSSAGR